MAKPKKILIVDDREEDRALLKLLLRDCSCIFVEGENTQDAIELLKTDHDFDLIISDYDMHGPTGIDLLKSCKSTPATAQIPFLLLTANPHDHVKTECVELGGIYMSKDHLHTGDPKFKEKLGDIAAFVAVLKTSI